MPVEISPLGSSSLLLRIYSCFRSLIQAGGTSCADERALGGRLLYAGGLDDEGRTVVLAGNIGGCATLVATADSAAQKQAIRDGVVDFLVTSLDEAVRILKNEIRKQGTVAVCVGASPDEMERAMLVRGVQPDLTRESAGAGRARSLETELPGADAAPLSAPATVVWQVDSSPARWLPKLDAIALECIAPEDACNRLWLSRMPRYLGRLAPNLRLVRANRKFAASFVERLRMHFDRGDFLADATVRVEARPLWDEHHFTVPRLS